MKAVFTDMRRDEDLWWFICAYIIKMASKEFIAKRIITVSTPTIASTPGSFSSAEKRAWYTRMRQNPQKSWGFGYYRKIIVAYLVYDRRLFAYSLVHTWYARTNSKINPTHHGETVSDIHYGIFYGRT